MSDQLADMQNEINSLKTRNLKVESEKAWETSLFRKLTIVSITYVIAVFVFWAIGTKNIFLNALVPTVGYFLSTLSIPVLKKWWVNKLHK